MNDYAVLNPYTVIVSTANLADEEASFRELSAAELDLIAGGINGRKVGGIGAALVGVVVCCAGVATVNPVMYGAGVVVYAGGLGGIVAS